MAGAGKSPGAQQEAVLLLFTGGLEARGTTERFWSNAGVKIHHHQSPAESYPGSRAADQAPVEDVLRRDGQWGKGGSIRGFGPERESAAHFQRFDRQNSDHFDSGGNWRNMKRTIPTFDSIKKDAFVSYQAQVKKFGRRHDIEKVSTGEQPNVDVMVDGVNMWDLEARFRYRIVQENMKAWEFPPSCLKRKRH